MDLHENMHRHLPCVPANHPELDELQHLAQQVIPQYDGQDDSRDTDDIVPVVDQVLLRTTLQAPYQLNQQKQVAQLVRDSNIAEFEVITNDSDRNVNILCSVGFYEAVAKSALSSLSTGFQHQAYGVTIRCTIVRKTIDQQSSMPGLPLRFELSGTNVSPNPAPLSLHLHNTQRKVQIQG